MACFLVPTTEAIVTTVIKKVADKKDCCEKAGEQKECAKKECEKAVTEKKEAAKDDCCEKDAKEKKSHGIKFVKIEP